MKTYKCLHDLILNKQLAFKRNVNYYQDKDKLIGINGSYKVTELPIDFNLYFEEVKIKDFNNDKVSHPSHYTWLKDKCGIEVIDITRHMDFCLGNACKYLLRCGHKSEEGYTANEKAIEDLEKAIFYIKDKINQLKSK